MLDESRQATGVKVGEVTDTSAIIWTRVTEKAKRRADGIVRRDRGKRAVPPEFLDPNDLEGSVPGADGQVRVRYSPNEGSLDDPENEEGVFRTRWRPSRRSNDYTNHFYLEDLEPATVYYFATDTRSLDTSVRHKALQGRFETGLRRTSTAT
jgi:alkaline phosphatase D